MKRRPNASGKKYRLIFEPVQFAQTRVSAEFFCHINFSACSRTAFFLVVLSVVGQSVFFMLSVGIVLSPWETRKSLKKI